MARHLSRAFLAFQKWLPDPTTAKPRAMLMQPKVIASNMR